MSPLLHRSFGARVVAEAAAEPADGRIGRAQAGMAENNSDDQVPVEELTPEEANRIIHSHRKVRYGTLRPAARP